MSLSKHKLLQVTVPQIRAFQLAQNYKAETEASDSEIKHVENQLGALGSSGGKTSKNCF